MLRSFTIIEFGDFVLFLIDHLILPTHTIIATAIAFYLPIRYCYFLVKIP
ncbi:hypothetical protein [Cytobacillus praedii]|nr:hypothetical protein [Cytobacillus praedii]